MQRLPGNRPPTHPGEILREEFLDPLGITQTMLARAIHVPFQRVNELINGKRGVTTSTALRLARFFGTTAEFWLNLQQACDLYDAVQSEQAEIQRIQPFIPGLKPRALESKAP